MQSKVRSLTLRAYDLLKLADFPTKPVQGQPVYFVIIRNEQGRRIAAWNVGHRRQDWQDGGAFITIDGELISYNVGEYQGSDLSYRDYISYHMPYMMLYHEENPSKYEPTDVIEGLERLVSLFGSTDERPGTYSCQKMAITKHRHTHPATLSI